MPVIAHAFAGLAIAAAVPAEPVRTGVAARPRSFWLLALLGLSYLPDILTQLLKPVYGQNASVLSHSVLIAVIGGGIAGLVLSMLGVGVRRAVLVAIGAVLLHDAFDILQSPGREPFWPFLNWESPDELAILPRRLWGEAILCVSLLAATVVATRNRARGDSGSRRLPSLTTVAMVASMVAVAVSMHYVRGDRERALRRAYALVERRDYAGAIREADRADRWPAPARPGRSDYVRAEAWLGLGDRDKAEQYYLRSHRAAPDYFWTVADLAVLQASGGGSAAERARRAEPWITLLKSGFAGHPALERNLQRVRRALERTP